MKRTVFLLLFIFTLGVVFAPAQDQIARPAKLWREIDDANLQRRQLERQIVPHSYRTFALDKSALGVVLGKAPMEFTEAARNNSPVLTVPMPDGTFARFYIEESPIFESSAAAAKYPEIKTYRARGIDDPAATARFDFMPTGFHAIVLSPKGTVLIDPYAIGDASNYISYFKSEAEHRGGFACHVRTGVEEFTSVPDLFPDAPNVVSGANLRTYRLALAATGEYTNVFRQGSDTDAQARARALEQMVLIMNRVNGVFEREVSITMRLVSNQDAIIYTDPATDPYTNESGSTMLGENQANLDSVIGAANYDIGHVFSTGGGGIAGLRTPCGANKARGVTGLPFPIGDPFAIDFVAHEIGHQFGGNHTFNGVGGNCAGNSTGAAYEPGSGVTIMGYAGICSGQNLAGNSIDTFHVKSIEEIVSFSTNGAGNVCAAPTSTGNTPPEVTIGISFTTIPKQTPFSLTATATDANGDTLTYDWQEYDLGAPATTIPNSDEDGMERPIFRSFLPTTEPTRTFPRLIHILNSNNRPPNTTGGRLTGEILPSISRTMLFQVIVRDNRANGGGVRSRFASINIDGTSGPLAVTAPNTAVTWAGNSAQTVTWDVANTNNATVNAQTVKISLSTDGGVTFPTVLAASTANDGSETITVPNVNANQARIKIEAVENIFFDISNANFSITPSAARTRFDFDGDGKADVSVFRPDGGIWYLQQSQSGFAGVTFGVNTDRIVPADYDGDGKTDVAVFRNGTWYIQQSQAGFTGVAFGAADDLPVPADYDGDGKTDVAVFRNGTWYIQQSQAGFIGVAFGQAGDKPVAADYDGDGKADVAVFRAGTWYIQRSLLGYTGVAFGFETDKPVAADYDGDGKADVAVFRNGTWYIQQSQAGFTGVAFGTTGDLPAAADYDGDGKTDVAVFRNGTWYIQQSQAGFTGVAFGAGSDKPVPNAFVY